MASITLRVPKMAVSMQDGVLLEWYADNGGEVTEGEPLYSLEIEKTAVDVEAPASGTLTRIGEEGETYPVGEIIGEITAP